MVQSRQFPPAHPAAAEQSELRGREGEVAFTTRDSHGSPASGNQSLRQDRSPGVLSRADGLYLEQRVEARQAPGQDLQSCRLPTAPRFFAADSTPRSPRPLRTLILLRTFSTASPIPSGRAALGLVLMLTVARDAKWGNKEFITNCKQREKNYFFL